MLVASPPVRPHKVYDPRLRDLVFHTGDVAIARDSGVPRSTRSDWKNGKFRGVVTLDVFDREKSDLQAEVLKLRRRLRICRAVLGLLVALLRVCGLQLKDRRLPDGKQKDLLLKAIYRASKSLPLKAVLRVIGLSAARYHSWRRAQVKCELDDRPSCPKSQPTRVCAKAVRARTDALLATGPAHGLGGRVKDRLPLDR